jgi:hypothetical protein
MRRNAPGHRTRRPRRGRFSPRRRGTVQTGLRWSVLAGARSRSARKWRFASLSVRFGPGQGCLGSPAMILPRGRSRKRFNEFQELRVRRSRAGFLRPARGFRFFLGARCPVHMRCFASTNGVKRRHAQRSGAAVRIPGQDLVKVAPAVPVHLCSFFAGHL